MDALVECVPNFSEGRRRDVIERIAAAAASVPIHILDVSSDADHNRSVLTLVGRPHDAAEAAFRAIAAAAECIDLTAHQGVHPRVGAADVVPFVPLRAVTLADCAALAHRVGARVGSELSLPVYMYEAAAQRPERGDLAFIRRGGYEALKLRIMEPDWQPDYGPAELGPAGAVVIGARGPLIAFNVYLDTDDVTIAQQIARTIRTSGGGLPALKALGLLVGGSAQVSMNLTDFRKTSLHAVMGAVRDEAASHGVSVTRSELIGLIPEMALLDYALEDLQLPAQSRDNILEFRLGHVTGDYRPLAFE